MCCLLRNRRRAALFLSCNDERQNKACASLGKPLVFHLRYASRVLQIRSQCLNPGDYRAFFQLHSKQHHNTNPTPFFLSYKVVTLRGTIINRTYGTDKNLLFTYFFEQYLRRSTIKVHPNFSEAPHLTLLEPQSRSGGKPVKFQVVLSPNGTAVLKGLRSSIPPPENWLRQKSTINSIPMNNPMAQEYKKRIFSKQDCWHSDDFGLRNPVIQKKKRI